MNTTSNFKSTSNSATVTFTSDQVVEASGFQLDYTCKNKTCDGNNPDWSSCCTSSAPCDEGQGHCDNEFECLGKEICDLSWYIIY